MVNEMLAFICLIFGFLLGYWVCSKQKRPLKNQTSTTFSYQQRLYKKAIHQNDADRIRELNQLSSNQSVFLRLLKQNFPQHDIAIKQQRFFVLDQDHIPCAIFEYRDGTQAFKMIDQEDGLPLHLYKGLLSSEALKADAIALNLRTTP